MSTVPKAGDGGPMRRFDTIFTDDDLKRLKECEYQDEEIHVGLLNYYTKTTERINLSALINRLEAAEAVVNNLDDTPEDGIAQDGHDKLLEAWRKAVGR